VVARARILPGLRTISRILIRTNCSWILFTGRPIRRSRVHARLFSCYEHLSFKFRVRSCYTARVHFNGKKNVEWFSISLAPTSLPPPLPPLPDFIRADFRGINCRFTRKSLEDDNAITLFLPNAFVTETIVPFYYASYMYVDVHVACTYANGRTFCPAYGF